MWGEGAAMTEEANLDNSTNLKKNLKTECYYVLIRKILPVNSSSFIIRSDYTVMA